ncbi:MAG: endonuclease V [Crocinitomix sp.]|nr:endonuclease V [Crocinitomix sp.]
MILAIDIHYKPNFAKNVGVLFDWSDTTPKQIICNQRAEVAEYVPGEFYKRELPCILDIIAEVNLNDIQAIVVDGHVYIDNDFKHGLGAYLYEELNQNMPIIGVAKRAFHKNEETNIPVLRGESENPLYVSAIGMDVEIAAQHIKNMHGEFRMPTILQILDTETKKD